MYLSSAHHNKSFLGKEEASDLQVVEGYTDFTVGSEIWKLFFFIELYEIRSICYRLLRFWQKNKFSDLFVYKTEECYKYMIEMHHFQWLQTLQ